MRYDAALSALHHSRDAAQLAASELQKELVEEIPVLRPKAKAAQAIPEMFMLPQDAKAQLTGKAASLHQLEAAALHRNELCRVCPSCVSATAAAKFWAGSQFSDRPWLCERQARPSSISSISSAVNFLAAAPSCMVATLQAAALQFVCLSMQGSLGADALKPNPDMLEGIMGNSALMKGFDDPEVMAAVDDVAKHPENLQKYRGNPKASPLLCFCESAQLRWEGSLPTCCKKTARALHGSTRA